MTRDSERGAAPAGAAPRSAAHLSPADAVRHLPGAASARFATVFTHGTLAVEIYAPRGTDPQTPHARDELYVVVAGGGTFWDGETRRSFAAGDLIFVAAGRPHRFEDFSDDFAAWVIFYGPKGGETSSSAHD